MVEEPSYTDLGARHPPPPPSSAAAATADDVDANAERKRRRTPGPHGLHLSLHFSSRSFLYNQIRRMVGAALQVGMGSWGPARLAEMLEVDSRSANAEAQGGNTAAQKAIHAHRTLVGRLAAPPQGLFLASIEYPWNLQHDWKRRTPAPVTTSASASGATALWPHQMQLERAKNKNES